MPSTWSSFTRIILFFALPLLLFLWTKTPRLEQLTLYLLALLLLVVVSLWFMKKETTSLRLTKTIVYVSFILTLVGASGWFFSPFFFLLYLTPLYLGFLYTPAVAFAFLAALLLIFSSNLGEIDVAYDVLTLISLLLVIPLVIYLRKKYLIVRQTKKDILILEDESGIKDLDTIGKLLANKVTSLGVNARQPLTYIRQAIMLLREDNLKGAERSKLMERIEKTATQTLDMIRSFEGKASRNVVLHGNEKKKVKKP